MIPPVEATAGCPVTLRGYAQDFGHAIVAVEFSADEGQTWSRYETPGAASGPNVNWEFAFTPPRPGIYRILVRSVRDDGKASPEAASVSVVAREA